MSNARTLDRALGEVLSDIRNGLADILKEATTKEIENIRKAKGLHKLIEKQGQIRKAKDELYEKYQKEKAELENQYDQLGYEINKRDCQVVNEKVEHEPDIVLNLVGHSYRPTLSQLIAAKKISKTVEFKNYKNFLDIEKNTLMMYNLAVTSKEKRNIILSIQTRDWRSVGIDIPQLPFLEKFEIENGIIKVPDQPLLQAKN
jgi:hypothetical protein